MAKGLRYIPDDFKDWIENYDVLNGKKWSWDDTEQERILMIAWRAYNKGVANTREKRAWLVD